MTPARSPGPTIAVIVPNRNDSRHIQRCLRSVLAQDVGPDELIVVDDQSTDDSVAVIRSVISGYSQAQLVENPVNLGVYGAIDEGLKRSRSDYVLFLAANDFVLPGIFARAKACLERAPGVGLWSAMAWIVDERDRPVRLHLSPVVALGDAVLTPTRCVQLAKRLGGWFTGTTMIFRRTALEAVGRFDPAYMGLSDLITALMVASREGAAYTPEPLAVVRMHADSYLFSRTLGNPEVLEGILEHLRIRAPRHAPELFTAAFLDRTARRFRFASVRASQGAAVSAVADRSSGWTRRVLYLVDFLLPRSWRLARVALAFLILRPFDILPSIWNRIFGWALVRYRSRWSAPP